MEWGSETVYAVLGAVVTGVLGWVVRGLSVKKQLQAQLEVKLAEERKRIAKLEQKLTATSKADTALKVAQARKIHEKTLDARRRRERKQRLQDYSDMIGLGKVDDDG